MRLLKRILIIFVVLILGAVAVAWFLPDHTHGERSIVIERPPSMVFGLLNGFGRFNDWSPWAGLDPKAVYTRSGPESGVGAHYAWKGNAEVREGAQEILESEPYRRIQASLDFGAMGAARSTYVLVPEGQGTRLTWSFDSALPLRADAQFVSNLIGRLIGPWIGESVGKDYERGLASLKKLLESMPTADLDGLEVEVGDVVARPTYYVTTEAGLDTASSTAALIEALGEVAAFATLNALQQQGPPRAVISGHSKDKWMFDVALPFDRGDAPVAGRIKLGTTYAGKVALFKHSGSYATLADTHAKAHAWLALNGYTETGRRSEIYVNDPVNTAEADLMTVIEVPLAQ